MNITFRGNEYATALSAFNVPKTVWMALAFSFADRLTGGRLDVEAIRSLIREEWRILHDNGIVPQKPRKTGGL